MEMPTTAQTFRDQAADQVCFRIKNGWEVNTVEVSMSIHLESREYVRRRAAVGDASLDNRGGVKGSTDHIGYVPQ